MDAANIQGSSGAAQQKLRSIGPPRYDGSDGNPLYDTSGGGHYGASASIASQGYAPPPEVFSGAWGNVNQGLTGNYRDILNTYWQQQITKLETADHDYKQHHLPLARIKKVMKADPEVKMISAEAPILFAEGCDIFITELTMRAWIHAEENKRRTLQRSDIASALAKSDMFDFLIDIVPREETSGHKTRGGTHSSGSAATVPQAGGVPQPGMPPQPHQAGGPSEYGMPQTLPPEADYRPQPGIYTQPVQPDPSGGYAQSQPQIFDQPLLSGYGIQPQMYQLGQRPTDPAGPADPGPHYRHDHPEDDVDAEGERDYVVV